VTPLQPGHEPAKPGLLGFRVVLADGGIGQAVREGLRAGRLDRGAAVADYDRVEGVHESSSVHRVAQSDVEVVPQPRRQEDVLVAVAPPPGLVGEISA
jgi:hypothetical protein